jgi:flagellar assembly protein FliH
MTSSDRRTPRQVPPPEGSTAKPAGAYSRFIPREELDAFDSWTPDAFAGLAGRSAWNPVAALTPQPPAPPPPPPAPVLEEPPLPDGPTEEEWLAEVHASRQSGYQDGYRDGLEALEAAKRQHLQQVSAQVASLIEGFDAQLRALEDRIAQSVVDTAVTLARQVVRAELQTRPELVARVAQEAVGAVMLSARHLRLRLNPEDLALVEAGAGEALRTREVMLQPDPALARGGCLVESDLGRVDARLETRWAQAAALFGAELPLHDPDEATAE